MTRDSARYFKVGTLHRTTPAEAGAQLGNVAN